ncbi:MAG: hypothetical protein ABI723_16570 [Bacteroidia bacterium]
MKRKIILSVSIIFLMLASKAQQAGSIFYLSFRIDPELTEYFKVDDKSRNWFSVYSESDAMPDEIIDSIKHKTESAFTVKLGMPVTLCYRKNNKGENVGSTTIGGFIENLPDNTFNKGKEVCPQSTRYIYLSAQIAPGGTSITIGNKKSKAKPMIKLIAKVYDADKNEVWKNDATIKDFAKLRSETRYYGSVEITSAETLTPYDIYAMYLMALDELMK